MGKGQLIIYIYILLYIIFKIFFCMLTLLMVPSNMIFFFLGMLGNSLKVKKNPQNTKKIAWDNEKLMDWFLLMYFVFIRNTVNWLIWLWVRPLLPSHRILIVKSGLYCDKILHLHMGFFSLELLVKLTLKFILQLYNLICLRTGFTQQGFDSRWDAEVASVRRHHKMPPCETQTTCSSKSS